MIGDKRRSEIARVILSTRELRDKTFPKGMFNDHAWIIILNLFVAQTDNRTLSKEELITISKIEPGSGARWLEYLIVSGQVIDAQNGKDVVLSSKSVDRMRSLFDDINYISNIGWNHE